LEIEDTRETLNRRTYASSEFKRKEIVIHVGIAHVESSSSSNSVFENAICRPIFNNNNNNDDDDDDNLHYI